ncbi:hypothetical protein R3P38DRAFT_2792991 [Favolaschia claudopus]|uniref:Uncharacterized protein n=1 Tax=Favolaschia claudopus TaxID=2862362 RepID=A0AAW0AD20_9AGAR
MVSTSSSSIGGGLEEEKENTPAPHTKPAAHGAENLRPPGREFLKVSGVWRSTSRRRPPAAKPEGSARWPSPASEMVVEKRWSPRHGVRPLASCYGTPVDVVGGARARLKRARESARLARGGT